MTSIGALVPFSSHVVVTHRQATKSKLDMFFNKARETRRLHVANVPYDCTRADLHAAIMSKMQQLRRNMVEAETKKKIPPNIIVAVDEIVDISIIANTGQPFAFIEVSCDDMATELTVDEEPFVLCRSLVKLRVRRTAGYVPMHGVDNRRVVVLGFANPDEQHDTFRELLGHFGELERFATIPNMGYYAEFQSPSAAAEAVQELNGCTDIGSRLLVVQLASDATRAWLLSRGLPVTGIEDDTAEPGSFFAADPLRDITTDICNLKMSLTQVVGTFARTQKHLRGMWPLVTPTRIVVLMNMFDPEEVMLFNDASDQHDGRRTRSDDDMMAQAVLDLRAEIEEEMEKYGRVRNFFMLTERPRPPTREDALRELDEERRNRENEDGGGDDEYEAAAVLEWSPEEIDKRMQLMMFRWYETRHHPVLGESALGKVFVEYESVAEAEAAQTAIAGRLFNGRTIVTSYLFEDVLYPPEEDEHADDGSLGAGAAMAAAVQQQQQQLNSDHQNSGGGSAGGAAEDLD